MAGEGTGRRPETQELGEWTILTESELEAPRNSKEESDRTSGNLPNAPIDILISGAKVVDGTGGPCYCGDILVKGDRIVGIVARGEVRSDSAREVVDARGMVACPGFIDIQSHSICSLLADGRSLSKVTQGVTTEIMGETWTPAPHGGLSDHAFPLSAPAYLPSKWRERARGWRRFGDWLNATVELGVSPNIGSFVSGGTLRQYAMGMKMGPPNDGQLATMRRVMKEAMKDGAFGVSYALAYPPDAYASTEEIVDVCRVASQEAGIYITHLRSEGRWLIEAIDEAVEVGYQAGLPVEIYHLKAAGRNNWREQPRAIDRIEAAHARGLDVTCNAYPYTASATGLSAMLPVWAAADGRLMENISQADPRMRLRNELVRAAERGEILGPDDVIPIGLRCAENAGYIGFSLARIAGMRGQLWIDCLLDLIAEEEQPIQTVRLTMCEENVELVAKQPWVKFASDEAGYDPAWAVLYGPVHPRAYGAFARVLRRYVQEKRILTLEDAVRKMTWAVASRLGLSDRGRLATGCYADIVIFDPETIADLATFEKPHQLSTGVRDVWVNGVRVILGGVHTGATPGRFLKGRCCVSSG